MSGKVIGGNTGRSLMVDTFFNKVLIGFRSIHKSLIDRVELVTEKNKKNIASALGWGTAGALLAGPFGALAGLVFGGRTKEVFYVLYLIDGRNYLIQSDIDTFQRIKALSLSKRKWRPRSDKNEERLS